MCELEAVLKGYCWFPYLEKCKLCIHEFEYVLISTDMLSRFLKNHKLEKEKILYEG